MGRNRINEVVILSLSGLEFPRDNDDHNCVIDTNSTSIWSLLILVN